MCICNPKDASDFILRGTAYGFKNHHVREPYTEYRKLHILQKLEQFVQIITLFVLISGVTFRANSPL